MQCMIEGKPLVITEVDVKRLTVGNLIDGVLTCQRRPLRAQGSVKTTVSREAWESYNLGDV